MREISNYLDKLEDLPFPSYHSLKENSEKIYGNGVLDDNQSDSEIDAKEVDYIDYKLEHIRLRKDFFNKPKNY